MKPHIRQRYGYRQLGVSVVLLLASVLLLEVSSIAAQGRRFRGGQTVSWNSTIRKDVMDIVGSIAWRRVFIRSRLFWLQGGMSLITLLAVNLVWLPGTIYHIHENNVEFQRVAVRGVRDQIKLFLEQKVQEIKHQAMLFHLAFLGGCARHR